MPLFFWATTCSQSTLNFHAALHNVEIGIIFCIYLAEKGICQKNMYTEIIISSI